LDRIGGIADSDSVRAGLIVYSREAVATAIAAHPSLEIVAIGLFKAAPMRFIR
jgi:preprotein translocase subunit Sec61beta